MEIDFQAETPEGEVQFKGTLTKEEVDFLLRYAIISLMARGSLPIQFIDVEDENVPEGQLN